MSAIDITLSLPEDLVERAKAQGVLNNERIARLIEAEIERLQYWNTLNQSFDSAREAFQTDHHDMTEDDIMMLMNEIVHEVRDEQGQNNPDGESSA